MLRYLILGSTALALTGCAVQPASDFADVQHDVQTRVGQTVRWNTSSVEDAAARQAVQQLLSKPLTRDAAVQVALLNNATLQATFEDVGIAQADLVQAGLLSNPVFDGDAKFRGGGHWKPHFEVSVTEDFVSVLLIPMRRKIAAANLDAVKVRVAGEVVSLVAQTQSAYVTLQAAKEMLAVRELTARTASAAAEAAKQRVDAGNEPQLSADTEAAEAEELQMEVLAARADVTQARADLEMIMGIDPDASLQIDPALPDPPTADPAEADVQKLAREQSVLLAAARADAIIAARELGISSLSFLQNDTAVGAAAEREIGGHWELGPALTVPIPLFDQGQASRAKASAELRKAQQMYAAARVKIAADVAMAYSRLSTARASAERYRTMLIPLRKRITQEQLQQYNGMFVGIDAVLMAKRAEATASGQYVAALKSYWLARADLERAISGRLPASPATTQPRISSHRSFYDFSTPDDSQQRDRQRRTRSQRPERSRRRHERHARHRRHGRHVEHDQTRCTERSR